MSLDRTAMTMRFWNKRFKLRSGLLIVGCLILVVGALNLIFPRDRDLWRLNNSFMTLKHPPDTSLVQRVKSLGNLTARNEGCDYLVAELRMYTGSRRQIESFYAPLTVWSPVKGGRKPVGLSFIRNGNFEFNEYYVHDLQTDRYKLPWYETHSAFPDSLDWFDDTTLSQQNLYVVFVQDWGE